MECWVEKDSLRWSRQQSLGGVRPGCQDSEEFGKNRGRRQERNECLPGGFSDCCRQQKMQHCPGGVLDVFMQTASERRAAREPLQTGLASLTICEMIAAGELTGLASPCLPTRGCSYRKAKCQANMCHTGKHINMPQKQSHHPFSEYW